MATSHVVLNAETGQEVGEFDSAKMRATLPAGIYEVKFGAASWKGIEVRSGETTTIEPGVLQLTPNARATVVDSETGEKHGSFDRVSTVVDADAGRLRPALRQDRVALHQGRRRQDDDPQPAQVILAPGLKWKKARITTQDGKEVFRFDAVTHQAALPPGNYVVEIDGSKLPFPATDGEVFEVKP